jgi:hypothetical protein
LGGKGGGSVSSIHPCQEGRHAASGISNLVTKIERWPRSDSVKV